MAGTLGTITGQVRLDVRQAVAAYAALRAQNARTVYALRGTGDAFFRAGQTMTAAGGVMVFAFAKVVSAAAEYERKMDFFGAVTDTNAAKMDRLSDFTLKLAQDTIYSAGEIADGFIELGKSGITAEQIMRGVGEAMASLGAAGDIPLAQSGQIITSVISQFGLEAENATRVADLLAGAANASIADISDLGFSLKYVGGIAKTAGLEFEDVATAIAVLANAGIRGSTAGTTLRQMIVSLPGATNDAEDALKDLGIITEEGTNRFYDQAGNLKSLSTIYQILQDSMVGLTAEQKTQTLRTIFQTRALSSASVLMRAGAKGFAQMNKEMRKVSAAEVASKRLDNLSGDIEILRGNIETLMIEAGSPFQETLRGWVQDLTKLVQAFSNLDDGTQKTIVQTFALSGAVLLALGVFNLILGTIFRFAAYMLKLGAGISFVSRHIKNLWTWARLLVSVFGGPVVSAIGRAILSVGLFIIRFGKVITVVGAVITALTLLYQHWEPFHDLVNGFAAAIFTAIRAVVKFFATLVTNPSQAWEMIKQGFTSFVDFITSLPSRVASGGAGIAAAIGSFVGSVVGWFASLPGRVMGIIDQFMGWLQETFTMENIAYAIGYALGVAVRHFLLFGARILAIVGPAVMGVVRFFQQLPGRIFQFLVQLVVRASTALAQLRARMIALVAQAVTRTIAWFQQLPGRIRAAVVRMAAAALAAIISFAVNFPNNAAKAVTGTINWFQQLPGRVRSYVVRMVAQAIEQVDQMRADMIRMAGQMAAGFINGITGLPSAVGGILSNCVSAIKGQITAAFNAVREFASNMWKGFKAGLGISSPSYIEEAMFQMVRVTDAETKKLAKNTMKVQAISKKMAQTQFGVGDMKAPGAGRDYMRLASLHASNLNRVRSLGDASGRRTVRDARRRDARPRRGAPGVVPFRITNWREGTGYMAEIAQDVVDEEYDYDDSVGRMG